MIKIDLSIKIKGISTENFEDEYLKKFDVYVKPKDRLENEKKKYPKNSKEFKVLNYLVKKFPEIIKGKPYQLLKTINHFENKKWDKSVFSKDIISGKNKLTEFGNLLLDCFGYEDRFRKNVNRGLWLAKHLNIKSCVYCNAQSTITIEDKKALFQFDHFFSKSKYPYLSISLYNLIPSCSNCNNTKNNKDLNLVEHFHPYENSISDYGEFYLKYNPDPKQLFTMEDVKKQNLKIEFKAKHSEPNDIVHKHNKLYNLDEIYNCHQDIAEEILMKAVIYTNKLIKNHLEIEGLFPDKKTYLRYLLGNYMDDKEIHNRFFSKFSQDIAKQLGLLE